MRNPISDKIIRTCIICGESFHPRSTRQKCCNKPITYSCIVCGKDIPGICTTATRNSTCSKECAVAYSNEQKNKRNALLIRKCKFCGKEFTPTTAQNEYCQGPHYKQCAVCGKQFEVDVRKGEPAQTCSNECRYELQLEHRDIEQEKINQKQVLLEKYGVENAMLIPGAKEKLIETNRKRYGVDWYTQTDEYAERVRETSQQKYGVDHFLQSHDIMNRRKENVENTYGVDNVSKLPEVQEKIRKSVLKKYGVSYISQTHVGNLEAWEEFKKDPKLYVDTHYKTNPSITELCQDLGVCLTSVQHLIPAPDRLEMFKRSQSLIEEEVIRYLKSLDSSIHVVSNTRSVIAPYELDIYLPGYNLAIECNPTATHNSSFADPWNGQPKKWNYHQIKTELCEAEGIFLFHIFGHEWTHKKEIIKSMLRNILNKNCYRVYARNTVVKEVTSEEADKFLIENHRQGRSVCSVRLGLYFDSELISLMTFGKPRQTISSKSYQDSYELIRFCNKLNISVVGGASKLFKYFLKNYSVERIISYSDRAHTKGNIYPMLGFEKVRKSGAGYVWVDSKTDKAYSRNAAQKNNIRKLFDVDEETISTSTEKQVMESNGFVKVYDSGTVLWEYQK